MEGPHRRPTVDGTEEGKIERTKTVMRAATSIVSRETLGKAASAVNSHPAAESAKVRYTGRSCENSISSHTVPLKTSPEVSSFLPWGYCYSSPRSVYPYTSFRPSQPLTRVCFNKHIVLLSCLARGWLSVDGNK